MSSLPPASAASPTSNSPSLSNHRRSTEFEISKPSISASTTGQRVKIGQYVMKETIGTGSFGKVKLAEHALTGHKVAMKIINRKKIENLELASRVKREIQYLKFLRHPHIIKLYEVITTPADIIMVMEYAGNELFNFIVERGKMTEKDARRFFQQIIAAVEYCHRHKIVHRDLKPENLLLDPHDNVKIADFGLSNIMTDGDFLRTSCGSPNYAAPEVITGKLYAGPEVDIWSCGVILYVMICGRLPFDDTYIPSLFKKISEGIFSIPPFVSEGASELLKAMLIVDPVKRITIAEIRMHPWFSSDLPPYLEPLPDLLDSATSDVDEELISELVTRMNSNRDFVEKTLKKPNTTIFNKDERPIRVAYQLALDHKKILSEAFSSSKTKTVQSFFNGASPPPWSLDAYSTNTASSSSSVEERYDLPESIGTLSSSLPRTLPRNFITMKPSPAPESRPKPLDTGNAKMLIRATSSMMEEHQLDEKANATSITPESMAPPSKKQFIRPRWHLGIRSKSTPKEILLELYKAMQRLGIEWKEHNIGDHLASARSVSSNYLSNEPIQKQSFNPYRIEARWMPSSTGNLSGPIYFDLTLFKLEGEKKSQQGYLVDFRNMCAESPSCIASQRAMLFLEICAKLIVELTAGS